MDFKTACSIFKIKNDINTINEVNIKKIYYKLALKIHPDKGGDADEFKQLNDAYAYLLNIKNIDNIDDTQHSLKYTDIIKSIIHNFFNNYNDTICLDFFNNIKKDNALDIYNFIIDYNHIFNINNDILIKMKDIISNKFINDEIIILTPNLNDILDDNIFKLNILDNELCIPLWHHELHYDISNNDVIVKCEPIIHDNMFIDNKNNIYIDISFNINDLLYKDIVTINIANKSYDIYVNRLIITNKLQQYTIKNSGIL